MFLRRWALALPLVLAASLTSNAASTVRDNAGLFSADAVRQAQNRLDKLEQGNSISVTIETIDSLDGRNIDAVLEERAKRSRAKPGLFVLISKKEAKIEVERSGEFSKVLTKARNQEIRSAFIEEFKKRDFNAGLNRGVDAIETVLAAAKAESGGVIRPATPAARGGAVQRARPGPPAAPGAGGGGFGLPTLLGIGLLVLAVLFGIRLLGSLFGGGNRGYAGQQRMGGGPGYGAPGYGGGGMGGGGGGFMSSMFGGIGGALAGNWLYDQFSGRSHGGSVDQSSMGANAGAADVGDAGTEWGGGDGGADWGGDAGGGGDGGGGGDWGGGDAGGGDWGGGGGGGDWGGGGDGGGGGDW